MPRYENLAEPKETVRYGCFCLGKRTIKLLHVLDCFKSKVGWLVIVFISLSTISAEAEIVSGRIYDATRTFRVGDEITIFGKDPRGNLISVKAPTDKRDGSYRVFLPPGTYDVEFKKGNKTLRGKIQSFPQPVQQDIYLIE